MNAVTPWSPLLHFMDTDFSQQTGWQSDKTRWSEIWPVKACHKYVPYTENVIGHKIEIERLGGKHIISYTVQGCSLCYVFQSFCSLWFSTTQAKELPPLTQKAVLQSNQISNLNLYLLNSKT